MSTQYQSGTDVPTEVLAARLKELADVVARKRDRIDDEFTMRIPAECDRDADLVMSEAARRLSAPPAVQGELVAYAVFADNGNIRIWCADPVQGETLRLEYGDQVRPLYAAPQPAPDASALVDALERIARMDSMSYHSLESAKIVARAALSAYRKGGDV